MCDDLTLSDFKEKIQPAGCEEALDVEAYRMDTEPKDTNIKNMGYYADLGTPYCCDYLYIKDNKAILIEDTQLAKHLKKEKTRFLKFNKEKQKKAQQMAIDLPGSTANDYYDPKVEKERIKSFLLKENCLKVYGALLILCRLAQKHEKIANELKDKNFEFWFVINDEDDIKAIDNLDVEPFLREELKNSLAGGIGGTVLVKTTQIFLLTKFKEQIQEL